MKTITTLLLLAFALVLPAHGQKFPDRPIKLVAPYPAGAGVDVTARLVAETLNRLYGWNVVVENRGGAAGSIGTAAVANAKPDGYTLLWTSVDNYALLPALRSDLPYKAEDLTYIARLAENGSTLAVNAAEVPAKTLAEFIAYLKANPDKVFYGTGGIGSANHFTMELFEQEAGVKMTRVVYQGVAPATTDLLAGRVQIIALTPTAVVPHMPSGRLRLLAVTQSTRNPLFPDLPTIAELGYPAATVSVWYALSGPKGIPDDVRKTLKKAMAGVLADSQVKAFMAERGLSPAPLYGDELRDAAQKELAQWREVVRKNNIKAE
ncbi:MAG: tripartite tricarboxylate transporter substrate binding protein [Burkholderiales bacterium]